MSASERSVRKTADVATSTVGLSRLPTWLRFPMVMFVVMLVMALVVSAFAPTAFGFVLPGGIVCALVAVANLMAETFGIDANKS